MTEAVGQRKVARRGAIFGAMFLMATSAIGPGFITQTTTFTVQLGAAFAFAILASTLVDIAVQLNVWRVIGVSGERAQDLARSVNPAAGVLLSLLIVSGGLVFNIGNVAGTGLGVKAALGVDIRVGAVVSALFAVGIFVVKRAGAALDKAVVFLGALMIVLTAYIAVASGPDLGVAARNTIAPETVDLFAITTLIGGTVGGYMTYAGAHRLLDSGVSGVESVRRISHGSVQGVIITGVMRVLLFLAILGVVQSGADLGVENPTASAFGAAAGDIGRLLFGVIFWAAAMTSVIGASFTSVTFLTRRTTSARTTTAITVGFIALSLVLFLVLGKAPVTLLIFAGAFNGMVLPLGFTVILYVAWRRRDLLQGYRYPTWLLGIGVAVWLLTLYLGWNALTGIADLWR
ncbi:MAG: divalent metal cation transporter [Nocardioides sp.]|nr:divalent metal cation transporter [Nocardioides sp.]